MNKKTVWFPVFRKVVPAEFEEWLEALALQGWHIEKMEQSSSMKMTFHKTEPQQFRYIFDLKARRSADYIHTYEQFGWELVGQMASCYVWRQKYDTVRPESFSDMESRIRRNKRVRNAVAVALALFILGILVSLAGIGVCIAAGRQDKIWDITASASLLSCFAAYMIWVVRKINIHLDR